MRSIATKLAFAALVLCHTTPALSQVVSVAYAERSIETLPERVKRKIADESRFMLHDMTIFKFHNPPKKFETLQKEVVFAGVLRVATNLYREKHNTDSYLDVSHAYDTNVHAARISLWHAIVEYEKWRLPRYAGEVYAASQKEEAAKTLYGRLAHLSWLKHGELVKWRSAKLALQEAMVIHYHQTSWKHCPAQGGKVEDRAMSECEKWVTLAERALENITEAEAHAIRDAEIRNALEWLHSNTK